jgi:hypothetical protein
MLIPVGLVAEQPRHNVNRLNHQAARGLLSA